MAKTAKQFITEARTDNDLAFVWLILGGWAASDAYLYCYNTNATRASAAVQATNKLKEPYIARTLNKRAKEWHCDNLIYSSKHVNPICRR